MALPVQTHFPKFGRWNALAQANFSYLCPIPRPVESPVTYARGYLNSPKPQTTRSRTAGSMPKAAPTGQEYGRSTVMHHELGKLTACLCDDCSTAWTMVIPAPSRLPSGFQEGCHSCQLSDRGG